MKGGILRLEQRTERRPIRLRGVLVLFVNITGQEFIEFAHSAPAAPAQAAEFGAGLSGHAGPSVA